MLSSALSVSNMSRSRETIIRIPDGVSYELGSFCIPDRLLVANHLDRVVLPGSVLADRSATLAREVISDYGSEPFTAVGMLRGCYRFFNSLMAEMQRLSAATIGVDFVRVQSYVDDRSGEVHLHDAQDYERFGGKRLIIVEDVVETGRSMVALLDALKRCSTPPTAVRVVSLTTKRNPDNIGYAPDYAGFELPNLFIVGCGYEYNDAFRELEHVCTITPEAKEFFSMKRNVP